MPRDGKTFQERTLSPSFLSCSSREYKKGRTNPRIGSQRIGFGESFDEEGNEWEEFFNILWYLHCCPVQNQDHNADNYNPSYKIAKVQDYLENRYLKMFVPGQQLSLDETLIQAFGRIKFKVRIVTKAARYGIKIYVITDATTAFVLRVVIYTGKTTYHVDQDSQADRLKTVQIVNCLVEPFVGSHRTIYVDWFYTSLDLLKLLAEKISTSLEQCLPTGYQWELELLTLPHNSNK
jgi:hypothetical protein